MGSRSKKKFKSESDIIQLDVNLHTTEFGHMKKSGIRAGGAIVWYCPKCDKVQPLQIALHCFLCGTPNCRRVGMEFDTLIKKRKRGMGIRVIYG